jgi:hypothetical protein
VILVGKWVVLNRGLLLAVGLIAGFFLLFPGDATWVNDDPALIHQAVVANNHRTLATTGLTGSFGIPYGPLPIQIYQVMLLFTHNPLALVGIHAVVMVAVTSLALFSLGRNLRLPFYYGVFLVLSPWAWLSSRSLWDNSFNIPFGIAFLASYAAFLGDKKQKWLIVTIIFGFVMGFVHFMAFPLIVAVFGHIGYRQFRYLKAGWYWLILIGLLSVVVEGAYVRHIFTFLGSGPDILAGSGFASSYGSHVKAFFFPLRGGWLFTAQDFPVEWFAAPMLIQRGIGLLIDMSLLAYPLVWFGIAAALTTCGSRIIKPRQDSTVRETVICICLVALVLEMLFYGILGLMPLRHYFNSSYVVFALFAWLAIARIRQKSLQILVGGLHGVGMVGAIIYLVTMIHLTGAYGATPTLGVQRQVVRELSRYSETTAATDIDFFKMYPHCLWALSELEGLPEGNLRVQHVWIHKSRETPGYSSIAIDTAPPADATQYAVLPLSGDIHPR